MIANVCLDWDVINTRPEAWKAPSGLFRSVRKECYMQSAECYHRKILPGLTSAQYIYTPCLTAQPSCLWVLMAFADFTGTTGQVDYLTAIFLSQSMSP